MMFDAIIGAYSGTQYCNGNCPVCKPWSNVQTPTLSPICNCPFTLFASRVSSAFCTAGKRCFMSDEISKTSRKRLSTFFGAAGCARGAGAKKIPANNTVRTKAWRTI